MTRSGASAVGQLADDRLEVRLGAIYALEQVAGESRQQHQPAMEVLCAYLRERAAWNPDCPPAPRLPGAAGLTLARVYLVTLWFYAGLHKLLSVDFMTQSDTWMCAR